ncbi:argininosuccinate synthase [Seonamhaeicola sp.]|uniref:argininosuccinate synthase n=1 Tax=Seonamhaeicola sp. TaxID=1912245 RepID=UPI00260B236A|nr:argininosuccinate synthase [Seonamhaeicola sp.]
MEKEKVVLAYSGGLDTSFCIKYLSDELNLEVHTIYADTYGANKEFRQELTRKAYAAGVTSHHYIDIQQEFYNKGIKYLLFGNVMKHQTYPLSVSSERTFQAIAVVNYANELGAALLAHGCTGAGNDQIRFDLVFKVLAPDKKILSPVRDLNFSREKEVEYLKNKNVNIDFSKAQYSYNEGIWGSSIGGKETLNSKDFIPEDAWLSQCNQETVEELNIEFKHGEAVSLNGQSLSQLTLIHQLNEIGSRFAVGRGLHLGDTIIGLKGRIAFEAPAALMLIKAHELLEKHVLSKWQLQIKHDMATVYGNLLHEGLYLDSAARDIEKFLESTQSKVSGIVKIKLKPFSFEVIGVDSPFDLHNNKFGEYGEESKLFNASDVKGFIKLYSLPIQLQHSVNP